MWDLEGLSLGQDWYYWCCHIVEVGRGMNGDGTRAALRTRRARGHSSSGTLVG